MSFFLRMSAVFSASSATALQCLTTFGWHLFSKRNWSACSLEGSLLLTQFLPQRFDLFRQSQNKFFVSVMRQGFTTCRTMENQFYSFLKGNSFAPGSTTVIEVMILLILKTNVEFLKNSTLLAQNKTFKLIGLELPMEYEPACFGVASSSQAYKRVIVKLVEYFSD